MSSDKEQAVKEAMRQLKPMVERYLQQKGIDTRKNFRCLNPAHPEDKNPSMGLDKTNYRAHCFACGARYDIVDLVALDNPGMTPSEAFYAACRMFNIDPGSEPAPSAPSPLQDFGPPAAPPAKDYSAYFKECHARIGQTDYPQKRGLPAELIERFNLGYDPAWISPTAIAKGYKPPASPRLIIPTGAGSYIARDTRPDASGKYAKMKEGTSEIFNAGVLAETERSVFVVEGEIDALSIMAVGGEAVGIGSTSNAGKLLKLLEEQKPKAPLVIAMDSDASGQKCADSLAEGLKKQGLLFYRASIYGEANDANAALLADRGAFAEAVVAAEAQAAGAEELEAAELEAEREAYVKTSAAYQLQSFIDDIEKSKTAPFYPTGFPALDSILDGGLYAGLYVVGAISSLGKTTFCLQVADQIAAGGADVLIFSLEMARNELIAKSVSRHTYLEGMGQNLSTLHAKTTRGIMTGTRYEKYSRDERAIIAAALKAYEKYAHRIFFNVGVGDIGAEQIRAAVEKHIKLTGNTPVLLIDYLQIIAPYSDRMSDKQNTDKAVLELKRLSRDFSIPVIGISSFNRDNYTAPVNLASFKESGAIEYSCDVLLGLQYKGMDYVSGEREADRNKRVRGMMEAATEKGKKGQAQTIQVKVLKNRNGSRGDAVLDFYPMFNYFTETAKRDENEGWTPVKVDNGA